MVKPGNKAKTLWRLYIREEEPGISKGKNGLELSFMKILGKTNYNKENIEEFREKANLLRPKDSRRTNGFLNGILRMKPGDLMWVKLEDRYLLMECDGSWSYDGKRGLHLFGGSFLWEGEEVSTAISGCFSGGGILQRTLSKEARRDTGEIRERAVKKPEIISPGEGDFLETTSPAPLGDKKVLPVRRDAGSLRVHRAAVQVYPLNDGEIQKILERREEPPKEEESRYGDIVIEVYPKEVGDVAKILSEGNEGMDKDSREVKASLPEKKNSGVPAEFEDALSAYLDLRNHTMDLARNHMKYLLQLHYGCMAWEVAVMNYWNEIYKIFFK